MSNGVTFADHFHQCPPSETLAANSVRGFTMTKHLRDMSDGELRQIAFPKRQFVIFGRLWTVFPVMIVANVLQCVGATTYHANETYFGMPMNLVWVWFSVGVAALCVVDLGIANMRSTLQLQALSELFSRMNERPQ
jgi:hypothetical protein